MKLFWLILAICLAGCGRAQVSSDLTLAHQSTPPANVQTDFPTDDDEHEARLAEAEKQNVPFKLAPPNFAKIDFANFTYPADYPKRQVTLKNGRYEYEDRQHSGGGWFSFGHVFFTDLTGDGVQEAIVFLSRVDCGASCDGGAILIYIYGTAQNRPKLLWNLETGSEEGGCSLKEFKVVEQKLIVDIFGRCDDKMKASKTKAEMAVSSLYASFDVTRLSFGFKDKKFVRVSREIVEVGKLSARNYTPLIWIS